MQSRRRASTLLAPLAAGLGAALLCLSPLGGRAGLGIYDALLSLRPARAYPSELLLMELDEATGSREWDGEGIAEGLATMAEMGARYAVFPVSGSLSPEGGKAAQGAGLAASVEEELSAIDANVAALFDAIRMGSVSPKDSPRLVAELLQGIEASKARLLGDFAGARGEEEAGLEAALRLFGRAYLSIDPLSDEVASPSRPARGARGLGFAPALVDPDGARRRLALLSGRGSKGFEHAAFAALMDSLGGPALELGSGSLVIRRASPRNKEKDIAIPLARGGILIDWPRPGSGSPRRLPWGELARAARLEEELAAALADLGEAGLLASGGATLPGLRDYAEGLGREALRKGIATAEWKDARERYFAQAAAFLGGRAEAELLAQARARLGESASADEAEALRSRIEAIGPCFAGARETMGELARARNRLRNSLKGSFCIVAPSRAGPSLRPTPFGEDAAEGLATAAALGSILSGRFLRELPPILGGALGAALALATAIASAWLGRRWALAEGIILGLAAALGCALLFVLKGDYLSPLAPAAGPLAAALAALMAGREEPKGERGPSSAP